ncbi:BUD32 family EKC/KEOPS complex subunit [Clostridium sp. DL1XJH146]
MKKIKEFYSKRNKVSLIEKDSKKYIYKIHSTEKSFCFEKDFYFKLYENNNNKLKTPKLISCNENEKILVIEYIEGCTLIEKLEELEKINCENCELEAIGLILKLYKWIEIFYSIEFIKSDKIMLNDINFRNFIVKEDEIYGIDFEDLQSEGYKDRTGELIAFYLMYKPIFSIFKNNVIEKVIDYLVEEKGYNEIELKNDINKELNIIKKRRGSL